MENNSLPRQDKHLLRAHSREHIECVANALDHFDLDTLLYPNIEAYARRSAGAAIEANLLRHCREAAFSFRCGRQDIMLRDDRAMGFCYFLATLAIAALDALESGAERDCYLGF